MPSSLFRFTCPFYCFPSARPPYAGGEDAPPPNGGRHQSSPSPLPAARVIRVDRGFGSFDRGLELGRERVPVRALVEVDELFESRQGRLGHKLLLFGVREAALDFEPAYALAVSQHRVAEAVHGAAESLGRR